MTDADMIEAMARTEAPDFIEGLQGFASMCERSLSIEDGPMLAAKFRDAAFCISIAKSELDRLRAENARLREVGTDALTILEFAFNRIHVLPRSRDTELANDIDKVLGRLRAALSAPAHDGEGR